MPGGAGEKTEKATPKRRRDERKKGNVMFSQDVVAVATLFASYVALRFGIPIMVDAMDEAIQYCFQLIGDVPNHGLDQVGSELASHMVGTVAKASALPLLATILAAVVATFAQTKLLVSFESLRPKFGRMNPLQGIKRLFSLKSIVEVFKNVLKITILLILIYRFVSGSLLQFSKYMDSDIGTAVASMRDLGFQLLIEVGVAFVIISFFDYLYQRWQFERDLRMSKEEIKEEFKQTEGDPKIKGKIKEVQRKMAQSRMMQAVPGADVVIRNPTHFAVALRYRPGKDLAPVVVAKGQDELALRIVAVAEEHHVAVVENKPLARALYAGAEIGGIIPPDQYGPVAEVLVYIYKLNHKTL
ncbi:MAG: flagellar biosynthesis protein FlhB [Butyricicoccus sp.]|nr:flagellar biosynthesis protein FlhB [Butyricicoccus sp.]